MASPDAPPTTSAPVPVRGIDRQASGVTRLHLDASQPIPSAVGTARQRPLDRARNRLLRNLWARPGRCRIKSPDQAAPGHCPAQLPCAAKRLPGCSPWVHPDRCRTEPQDHAAPWAHPAQPLCETKAQPGRSLGGVTGPGSTNCRGCIAPQRRPAQPP